MNPNAEPNSLPPLFADWLDWRETYNMWVAEYLASRRTTSDLLRLNIRLSKLGFSRTLLQSELEHIKAC